MTDLLRLIPDYYERVWGGRRLKPDAGKPIGEAWIVHEHNRVAAGRWAGRSLAAVAGELGAELLGLAAVQRTGLRFPLLIKLLDCVDWLSVQVHPNDEQAERLEGPGQFGKTEAWHILEAEAGAQIIAGVQPGVSGPALAQAIRAGAILEHVTYHSVQAGDTVFMPAGTIHALGPGLLLYEVQQTSDITYRVFDWNRPAAAGRTMHIEQSAAVSDAAAAGDLRPLPPPGADLQTLVTCSYFTLDLLSVGPRTLAGDTHGRSFHALTVIEGQAVVENARGRAALRCYETVIVPAVAGGYQVSAAGAARVLCASVGSAH
jgi:mannose-6-phosphate isomerase